MHGRSYCKVWEVCEAYLGPAKLLPVAQEAVEQAQKQNALDAEL